MTKAEEVLELLKMDEANVRKRKIREIIGGGGVRELRGLIDLGCQLADAMMDPKNKLHPTPESGDDAERVKAARHFLRAAMSRLRGVKELQYGQFDANIPDSPKTAGLDTELDFEG